MIVVLIGLRCSGKSSIGPKLARALSAAQPGTRWKFSDLDTASASALGKATVREAWDTVGEAAFRDAESKALARALSQDSTVLATGGGTPTAPGAAALLRAASHSNHALIVYLRGTPAVLQHRMRASKDIAERPTLTGADPIAEIPEVFRARDELYRSLARIAVELGPHAATSNTVKIITARTLELLHDKPSKP